MEEFPRSLREFEEQFATEQACRDYLFRLRWPDGFRCPRCSGDRYWPVRSVLLECRKCGHQTSVTAGTIFQDTRKPLTDWFRAMYWVTTQKNGASALGLQRVLELKSYKTAWTWLRKLRRAMVRPGRDRLTGRIEVDETFTAGVDEGTRGRHTGRKTLIVIAAQEDGPGIGRIRSTAAGPPIEESSSTVWCSKPSPSTRHRTNLSSSALPQPNCPRSADHNL